MSLHIRFLVLSALVLLVASCGSTAVAGRVEVATSSHEHVAAATDVTQQITILAHRWEQAFAGSRWREVRDTFTSSAGAAPLISQMIRWQDERIHRVHVVPTFVQRVATKRYVGTLRFDDDPRAVPDYHIYVFELHGTQLRITGNATGLQGSDFTNVHWSVTRGKHFTIFHSPYELQGSDRQYLTDLEKQRAQIQREFGVRLPADASYYLYPDTSLMARLTGRTCGANANNVGCADPYTRPPSIHTSLWPTYHEPIHIYQVAFEPPPSGKNVMVAPLFIAEGMAVALEDRQADPRMSDYCSTLIYVPLDVCARFGIGQIRPSDLLTDRGFKRSDPGNAYALSGSFVKYLIVKYGYRSFAKFYYKLAAQPSDSLKDYNVATYGVYHTSTALLLKAWQRELCSSGCS